MIARYLLLFALLILTARVLCLMYVHILTEEINEIDVSYQPSNHRVDAGRRRTSARPAYTARPSTKVPGNKNQSHKISRNTRPSSYEAYRNSSSR